MCCALNYSEDTELPRQDGLVAAQKNEDVCLAVKSYTLSVCAFS